MSVHDAPEPHSVELPPPTRDLPAGRHEFHKENLMTLIDNDTRTKPVPPRRRPFRLRPAFALPAARPSVRRRLAVGVAAVTVGAVAAVTAPSLLPGTAGKAFASWTPTPGSLTGEQVLPQARNCAGNAVGGSSSTVDPKDVLLAEQRGLATLLIMKKSDRVIVECMSAGPDKDDQLASMSLADGPQPPPPAGTVDLQTMSSTGEGRNQWSNIVGLVGPGVTGVDVRLDNGKVFQASVKSGWWAAWWPGPQGGEVDHLTVIVHTGTGTTNHRPSELA